MPAATVGRIPVRNLWLLMLYASRLYRELPTGRRFAAEDNPDEIPDLVAEILTRAVERRLRRNLSSEFDQREVDLTRVRGRIDVLRTERRHLLQRGRMACSFDELTTDTPKNRYVRAALNHLHQRVRKNELKPEMPHHRVRAGQGGSWHRWSAYHHEGRQPTPGLLWQDQHRGPSDAGCGGAGVQPEASHGGGWSGTTSSAGPGRAMGQVVVRGGGGRLLRHCALTPGLVGQNWQQVELAGRGTHCGDRTDPPRNDNRYHPGTPCRSRFAYRLPLGNRYQVHQHGRHGPVRQSPLCAVAISTKSTHTSDPRKGRQTHCRSPPPACYCTPRWARMSTRRLRSRATGSGLPPSTWQPKAGTSETS